jgi:hypothetical protein
MRTLRYQVLISEGHGYVHASIPDLCCEAVGATPAAALAVLQRRAARALSSYEDHPDVPPPTPVRLSLTQIELPAPARPAYRLQVLRSGSDRRPSAQAATRLP